MRNVTFFLVFLIIAVFSFVYLRGGLANDALKSKSYREFSGGHFSYVRGWIAQKIARIPPGAMGHTRRLSRCSSGTFRCSTRSVASSRLLGRCGGRVLERPLLPQPRPCGPAIELHSWPSSGLYVRLVATLFVPLFGSACIFGLAALAALSRRKDRAEGLDDHALSAPRVWVLHQWLLLLLYPMLCHTIMSTFDCIDLRGEYLLRSDVTVVCYQGSWFAWATVAIFAGILYCIGVPLAAFAAARAYKDSRGRQRQRVLLLLNPYIASFWWFESVDLIRKCLLTSVVLITYAGTTLQLGFGWVIAAASCLIYTNLQPYRGRLCGHISTTAQLSILFTYITAILLASYEVTEFTISKDQFRSQAFVGPMLMLSNLACFILLAGFFLLRAAQASDRTDFTLLLNGAPIQLLDPNAAGGHHIFLSHCWAHAQDQCAEIKRAVNMLLPSVQIFLDVDDLQDIAELERHVQDSDLLLIFLTKEYFSSANCRRELKQGLTLGKEIVVITESDAMHGASTLDELQAEIEELPPEERAACEAILLAVENADAIEWHREIYLKRVALRHIVYKL